MKTILFAHDKQGDAYDTINLLEVSGHVVTAVTDGEAVIESLSSDVPSLLLMDILLEGMNGFEVCRQVRRLYPVGVLPIILSSEIYRSRHFRAEALSVGAQDYILKPFRGEELVARISELAVARTCDLGERPLAH